MIYKIAYNNIIKPDPKLPIPSISPLKVLKNSTSYNSFYYAKSRLITAETIPYGPPKKIPIRNIII